MTGFTSFGLADSILSKLQTIGFTHPTPIQQQAIPHALDGKDILGTAQTGTGKTAAFGLPLVQHLMNNPHSTALVMTPTRELALQVMTQLKSFFPDNAGIRAALLIGGEAMFKQLKQLQGKPRLIIGTPGRINDHLDRDTLRLSKSDFLVLDEADRMLDMGFGVQLETIAGYLPEVRQTLLFSATVPQNIMKLARNYLKDPVRIETAAPHLAAPKIKQELIHVNDDAKHDELVKLLDARSGQIIVFVKTKHGADKLARRLSRDNHSADAIHGDLRQGQRDRVLKTFRNNDVRILVATDVAARGLDIPMLETVINFDLPQCPEDYIHRIGRTGRNGAEGEAICLITGHDRSKWAAIDRLMNPGKPRERSDERSGGRSGSRNGKSFGGKNRHENGRNGAGFGGKKFGGNSSGKPNWKSSFADKPSSSGRDGDNRGDSRRFERDDRPRKEWKPDGAYQSNGSSNGERGNFKKKSFGGERQEGGFKKEGGFKSGGFKKQGGFKKEGERKEWGSRDGGSRNESSRGGGKFGSKPAVKSGNSQEGGFKKEGGFKSGGFKKQEGYKKEGGFNSKGPRKPRVA